MFILQLVQYKCLYGDNNDTNNDDNTSEVDKSDANSDDHDVGDDNTQEDRNINGGSLFVHTTTT